MADDDPQPPAGAPATRVERPVARADAAHVPESREQRADRIQNLDTEPAFAAPLDRPSGTLDAGRRYELGEEIARGGMGRVLVATDSLLGRTVALKAALGSEPEAKRRFLRETKITARLEHPAIVPVYDAGNTGDGLPFYVMRKVAGRPLEALIRERRAIDDRLALLPNVLAAVDAVAHAHVRGVVHRDLKPANILVGELGETIVIDWGLAKVIDDPDDEVDLRDVRSGGETGKTLDGQVVGTPGFMAPEQLHGDPVTRSADVYALGSTLYHVLAGEPPHAGRSSDEMIANALSGPPRPIDDVVDGVPDELIAIVDRAMAYDDFRRYADATELAADLRRFLTGQLVAAHRYSAVERAVRFVRRNRASTAIAVIAMAAMSIGAYVSITRIVREKNLASEAREAAQRERDAAEAARTREAERADDLLLAQAAALIPTNPTIAVGLLHQLPAGSKVWPRARDILAEARSRGVPWALPASAFTASIAIDRDGKVAYAAGSDGVVRAYDLDAKTAQVIHRGATLLALSSDDRWLALAAPRELIWLDTRSRTTKRVPLDSEIDQLAVAGDWAVIHAGGKLSVVGHEGSVVDVATPASKVFAMVASPDGKRVAINAEPDALVIELSAALPNPKVLITRPSRSMQPAWSADGSRVAFARVGGLDEIDLSVTPPATRAIATIPSAVQAAAYVGDDLYFSTAGQTAYRHHPRDGIVQVDLPAALYTSASASRDAAVFVNVNGLVALAGRGGTLALQGPVPRLTQATARGSATRILAAVHDHLLLYDAAQVLPRSLDLSLSNSTFHGFTGNQHYAIAYMVDDWVQVDLASGKTSSLGRLEFGQLVTASPDGAYVIARKQKSPELVVMRPGQPPAPLLSVTRAVALSKTRAVIADDHAVQALDLETNARTPLWTSDKPLAGLLGGGSFVVAYAPGTLWRYDDRSHATPTAAWTELPTAVDVASDGTVWFATPAALYKWPLDAGPTKVASLSRTLTRVSHVAGIGVLGIDDKRTASLFADGASTPTALPSSYELAFLAHDAPLLAGLTHDRKLAMYDLSTQYLWRLGSGETMADITDDGRHIATYSEGQLSIYALDLAADRDAYAKQLEATTNLRIKGTGNELVWPEATK